MEAYRRGSRTVRDCKHHLIWVGKHRHGALGGEVGTRCRESLRETAQAREMAVRAGSIDRGHIHMLVSIPPPLFTARR